METSKIVALCGTYSEEKKGKDVLALDVREFTDVADYFVLASGTSERHVRTIADGIQTGLKGDGIRPYSVEGYNDGRWVILDYQNVVVHVFLETLRGLYDLESLWIEAKRIRIEKEIKMSGVENGKRET
jgi:ribosome-associated protein